MTMVTVLPESWLTVQAEQRGLIKDGNDLYSTVKLSIKSRERFFPRNIKAIERDGYRVYK